MLFTDSKLKGFVSPDFAVELILSGIEKKCFINEYLSLDFAQPIILNIIHRSLLSEMPYQISSFIHITSPFVITIIMFHLGILNVTVYIL